jgi:hypothetical protein
LCALRLPAKRTALSLPFCLFSQCAATVLQAANEGIVSLELSVKRKLKDEQKSLLLVERFLIEDS